MYAQRHCRNYPIQMLRSVSSCSSRSLPEATPIIARELGPYPEIIQRSQGGFLFNTQQELSNALTRLSADSDLRNKMGLAGYNTFRKNGSEQAAMSAYFGLIEQLANHGKLIKSRRFFLPAILQESSHHL